MLEQNSKRLDILFRKHNDWLRACTWNICQDTEMVDELVSELYLYLAEKGNEKIYYLDSFNLGYCRSFIQSRFINKIKIENRYTEYDVNEEVPEIEYDDTFDKKLDSTYEEIKELIKSKQSQSDWASAKIAELYYFGNGFTIDSLAEHIGVSRSTVWLHVSKIKKEIKDKIDNPFKEDEDE